jgi:hypothetical protein
MRSTTDLPSTSKVSQPPGSRTRIVFWAVAIAVTGALLFFRRPDAVLHAQFWAEDGVVWFADAYNLGGFKALLRARDGYLQTIPRLACAAALWAPLGHAPLVTNLIALVLEALPPLFLISSRMRNLGPLGLRCVLALLLLFVPDSSEVHAIITDSEFQMAVLACLVVIAEAPRSWAGRTFDIVVLALFALTGPFCVLLFPVALLRTLAPLMAHRTSSAQLARPEGWRLMQLSLLAAGGLGQALTVITTAGARLNTTLGASPTKFVRIVGGQVVLPLFLGSNRLNHISDDPTRIMLVASALTIASLLALVYGLVEGSLELRCFILFALLVLTAALAYPTIEPINYQWDVFLRPDLGLRYWYLPKLALMATLVWLLGRGRPLPVRLLAGALACTMVFSMVRHWRYPALPDFHFDGYVRVFGQLPSGAIGQFRLNPGGPWIMELTKK